jgi:hypothetical protein
MRVVADMFVSVKWVLLDTEAGNAVAMMNHNNLSIH